MMKTRKMLAFMMTVALIAGCCVVPASAVKTSTKGSVKGAEVSENLLEYLEYCEVEIDDSSIIDVAESAVSRSVEETSSLHITTQKGDSVEETFLSHYQDIDNTLTKSDVGRALLSPTRASSSQEFIKSGVNIKMTIVYTRDYSRNYVNLSGHYFTMYKQSGSPVLNKIESSAYVVGDLYDMSSGKYTYVGYNKGYTSTCNINSPSFNEMYSGDSHMPSDQAIVPVNALGGLGAEFSLYINGSSSPIWDMFCPSLVWY